jgi:hypothetical protein
MYRQIPGSDGKGLVIGTPPTFRSLLSLPNPDTSTRRRSRDSIRRDPSDCHYRKRSFERDRSRYLLYGYHTRGHVPILRGLSTQVGAAAPCLPTHDIPRLSQNAAEPERIVDLGLVEERVGYGRVG